MPPSHGSAKVIKVATKYLEEYIWGRRQHLRRLFRNQYSNWYVGTIFWLFFIYVVAEQLILKRLVASPVILG